MIRGENWSGRKDFEPSTWIFDVLVPNYQGITFRSPFFFLLLDSFEESFLSSVLCDASVLLASALCEPSVAAASVFAGCSLPEPDAAAAFPFASVVAGAA